MGVAVIKHPKNRNSFVIMFIFILVVNRLILVIIGFVANVGKCLLDCRSWDRICPGTIAVIFYVDYDNI